MRKYIVTDPCYICDDDKVWNDVCDAMFENEKEPNYEAGAKILSEYLGQELVMSTTGFGDWSNTLYGKNVVTPSFGADAGLVCVTELTDRVVEILETEYSRIVGATFVSEGISLKDDVVFDDSDPNWVIVRINTPEGEIESDSGNSGEDEEGDDYWDEEE